MKNYLEGNDPVEKIERTWRLIRKLKGGLVSYNGNVYTSES